MRFGKQAASSDDRARRRWRLMFWGVFMGIPLTVFVIVRVWLSVEVAARMDAVRAQGLPITPEELDAWYPAVPDVENAAKLYGKAFPLLTLSDSAEWTDLLDWLPLDGSAELPPVGQPLPEEMKRAIALRVSEAREGLTLLHEAATYARARYAVDLTNGMSTDLSHLAQLRQATRMLGLDTLSRADSNDAEAVTQSLLASLGPGESLKEEPILISQLVRIACHGISADTLHRALQTTTFTDEQLQRLGAAYARCIDLGMMHRAMTGERTMLFHPSLANAANLMSGGVLGNVNLSNVPARALGTASDVAGYTKLEQRTYLETYEDFFVLLDAHAAEQPADFAAFNARLDNMPRFGGVLTQILMPALTRATEAQDRDSAILRGAVAALAVERFRLAEGRLPYELEELVPRYIEGVPLDTFDLRPLRYRLWDDGYTVYSIGPNRIDDGGLPPEEGKNILGSGDLLIGVRASR